MIRRALSRRCWGSSGGALVVSITSATSIVLAMLFSKSAAIKFHAPLRRRERAAMSGLISPSALSLLGVNLGVIVFALNDAWSLATILASYLVQSIVIGLFQARKIFST